MKHITLFILLIAFNGYSQDGFKKLPKGSCSIKHTCRLEYQHDSFENSDLYKIGHYETGLSNKKSLVYTLNKFVKDDKTIILWSLFGVKESCRDKDSYIHFQFKDGELLKLMTVQKSIDCGTSHLTVDITEFLEIFKTKQIDKIRIHVGADDDFEIYSKGQEKLYNNLRCIEVAKI